MTIGLALVAFCIFELEGFRKLGVRGYLGKFFPFGEFKNGIGAGVIALFVGLVELLLEFVKPVTLSMRLFGNIYGGEVALGVITALTIAIVPIGLYALEVMLNLIQALIFSTLTLMFIVVAIEAHDEEHDEREAARHAGRPGSRRRTGALTQTKAQHAGAIPATTEERQDMEHIGAGLAALGVIGPGIGIGILGRPRCRRDRPQPGRGRPDPRSRDHPRGVRRRPRRAGDRRRPARDLHQARPRLSPRRAHRWTSSPCSAKRLADGRPPAQEAEAAPFQINIFWIIVAATNVRASSSLIVWSSRSPVSPRSWTSGARASSRG